MLHCVNCGHVWTLNAVPGGSRVEALACPVCGYPASEESGPSTKGSLTADEVAERLSALMAEARAALIDDDTIVHMLSDELEFAAELAHAGRNMCVQIIDLGPMEGQAFARPVRDRSSILRRRALG